MILSSPSAFCSSSTRNLPLLTGDVCCFFTFNCNNCLYKRNNQATAFLRSTHTQNLVKIRSDIERDSSAMMTLCAMTDSIFVHSDISHQTNSSPLIHHWFSINSVANNLLVVSFPGFNDDFIQDHWFFFVPSWIMARYYILIMAIDSVRN